LDDKPLQTKLRYYGISPWEIEVLYGILSDKFTVVQEETGDPLVGNLPMNHVEDDQNLVSALIITIPVQFSEEFFQWFGFKRWEKVKSIIKEMKRRRGNRKAILVVIKFENGEWYTTPMGKKTPDDEDPIIYSNDERLPDYPHVKFTVDSSENHIFNSAIEKIDVMVELLPYHLNHSKMKEFCKKPMVIRYEYDIVLSKWYVGYVLTLDGGRTFGIDSLRG